MQMIIHRGSGSGSGSRITRSSISSRTTQQQQQQQQHRGHYYHPKQHHSFSLFAASSSGENDNDAAAAAAASSSTTNQQQQQQQHPLIPPQVISTGCSQRSQLKEAVQEATERALLGLPRIDNPNNHNINHNINHNNNNNNNNNVIDVALVLVSSLYDGQPWSAVVPTVYETCCLIGNNHGGVGSTTSSTWQLDHILGCTTAGVISSSSSSSTSSSNIKGSSSINEYQQQQQQQQQDSLLPVEWEGLLGVSVTLMQLPDTHVQIFHVLGEDVPDDLVRVTPDTWKRAIGITTPSSSSSSTRTTAASQAGEETNENVIIDQDQKDDDDDDDTVICLFPAPSFQTHLDDLIRGFSSTFASSSSTTTTTLMGAIASTVSSLSRARLFAYRCRRHGGGAPSSSSSSTSSSITTTTSFTEGCVGMILQGDVQIRTLMASGAKPVGGVYRIVKGQDSTIQVIMLDQQATTATMMEQESSSLPLSLPATLAELEEKNDDDDEEEKVDNDDDDDTNANNNKKKAEEARRRSRQNMADAYAKAAIPKPVLAEANFIMRSLSDDEQAFMRKAILVGLERRPSSPLLLFYRDDDDDDDNNNADDGATEKTTTTTTDDSMNDNVGVDEDQDDDDDDDEEEGANDSDSISKDKSSSSSSSSSGLSSPSIPATPTTTLGRLAQGLGHGYTVHQVASAGMKDGSVTFALGSVKIQPGSRMRFFVRERTFAKKEIQALWMGYKKRVLNDQFVKKATTTASSPTFTPTGCFVFPTLDRGTKFFLGKPGYESRQVAQFLPTIPSIAGFFCNSVIGTLDDTSASINNPRLPNDSFLHGSASGYFLIGSKSNRPIYSPALAAAERRKMLEDQAVEKAQQEAEEQRRERQAARVKAVATVDGQARAPRDANGELLWKRREVHAGRAISVSTIEWSVADKTAMPTSTLEGYMWDKEAEVDRFRERVPLSNLVSQCRLSMADPNVPKPRDFVGPILSSSSSSRQAQTFVIIPECKRKEPTTGSIRKRYDVAKLVKQFTLAGAPAISVNSDGVLFGGSLEDITKARETATSAAVSMASLDTISSISDGVVVPPILASDLILYPYQLYKLRLAGADAVNLVAGALAGKDVLYLTKIAASLQLQCLVTVTSEVQLRSLVVLAPGSIHGVIVSNRELEDFSFDMTGQQALDLLASDALADLKQKQGRPLAILVEGRVGIIQRPNDKKDHDDDDDDDDATTTSSLQYIKELKAAGATGAIVGEGIAQDESAQTLESLQSTC